MENIQLQNVPGSPLKSAVATGLLFILLVFAACDGDGRQARDSGGAAQAPSITVAELHAKVASGADFFLLDVRTGPEFLDERLAFTDLRIPFDSVAGKLDLLPEDKNTVIYSFCRGGRRSAISTNYLRSVGYSHAFNVAGGIMAWKEAGYKTISGQSSSE
ncbi:MAG: rhodanese-like domain-containing protein [candidate division Zixibacteria bacterium]|nr:rhodanese-like domain-containing protein [candidate division Zixibacteria bacterium]